MIQVDLNTHRIYLVVLVIYLGWPERMALNLSVDKFVRWTTRFTKPFYIIFLLVGTPETLTAH